MGMQFNLDDEKTWQSFAAALTAIDMRVGCQENRPMGNNVGEKTAHVYISKQCVNRCTLTTGWFGCPYHKCSEEQDGNVGKGA